MRIRPLSTLSILSLIACSQSVEGQFPGECSDEADNDVNGLFDCDDPSCAQSPACVDDDTEGLDTDTPNDTDPTTDTGTAIEEGRSPGPHPEEHGLVTAWNILTDSGLTDLSAACTETGGDWAALFAAPTYGDGYYYTFYRVDDPGDAARAMACGSDYPDDCSEKDYGYTGTQSELLKAELQSEALGNGCTLDIGQNVRIRDLGQSGELLFEVDIGYTGTCFGADENNGCLVSHTYALDFTAAP